MAAPDSPALAARLSQKVFFWVMCAGLLASIALYAIAYQFGEESVPRDTLRELAIIVAGVVVAALIQIKILAEFYLRQSRDAISPDLENVETRVVEEFRKVIPEVKTETVKSIDDIRERVTQATQFMLNGIDVLSGAKAAGIVNIFPTRYESISGKSATEAIRDDLPPESSMIRLMGISLGDYFLDRGVLHGSLVRLLDSSSRNNGQPGIRALLVHPKSETLRERARWEAGDEYHGEPAFYDSTTFIETDGAVRIAKRLCEKYPGVLSVRLYVQAPTAFVLLTSRFAFVEAYNYAARGSNVPVFQVQAGVPLYKHYESHFDRIWNVTKSICEYDSFTIPGRAC